VNSVFSLLVVEREDLSGVIGGGDIATLVGGKSVLIDGISALEWG
jgi:hypothetical protein